MTATDNLLRDAKPLSGNARNASTKDVNIIVCFRRGAKNHNDHVDKKWLSKKNLKTTPGATALTLIPSPAHSTANERLRLSTPARAAPSQRRDFQQPQSERETGKPGLEKVRVASVILYWILGFSMKWAVEQTFKTLRFFAQTCLLTDLHGGSQSLCRNPRLGNFKRRKGVAIVRRGGWRVDRGARGNTIHPHLKIDIFKENQFQKRSKL